MDLCCFGTQALSWMDQHDGVASWAQFIGAVLAIGAAFWTANAQVRHERRIAKAKRSDFLRAIADGCELVVNAYAVVRDSVERGMWLHAIADLGAIRELSGSAVLTKALEEPLSEWPSPMLFVRVQRFMFIVKLVSDMADKPLETDSERWNAMLRLIETRLSALSAAKGELDAEIARIRSI